MAGLLSWLFRRGSRRAVAELPQVAESAGPTSVQLAKQLVATPEEPADPPREAVPAGPPEPLTAMPAEVTEPVEQAAAPEGDAASEDEGEISPARLEAALQRLRQEIPASSEESSPGPST